MPVSQPASSTVPGRFEDFDGLHEAGAVDGIGRALRGVVRREPIPHFGLTRLVHACPPCCAQRHVPSRRLSLDRSRAKARTRANDRERCRLL
jgi:hypothetical protein